MPKRVFFPVAGSTYTESQVIQARTCGLVDINGAVEILFMKDRFFVRGLLLEDLDP
jgi:hypothetical protein